MAQRAGLGGDQHRADGRAAARPGHRAGRGGGAVAGPDRAEPGPPARHELALLKIIGMTRGQIRAVIAWQTTLTLLIAVVVGGLLGMVGGRLAWRAFAVPSGWRRSSRCRWPWSSSVLVVLVLAGDLLAALPAAVAARTGPPSNCGPSSASRRAGTMRRYGEAGRTGPVC